MTELRQRMDNAMLLRGFALRTRESYLDCVRALATKPDVDLCLQFIVWLLADTSHSMEVTRPTAMADDLPDAYGNRQQFGLSGH